MLLQRILTALVLAAVAIAAIFLLPTLYFFLFIAIIVLIGAWEWTALSEINKTSGKLAFLLFLIIPMLGVAFWTQILELISQLLEWPAVKEYSGALEWLVIGPVLFWVMMMMLIRKVPEVLLKIEIKKGLTVFIGWFILFSAWMFLVKLRAFYGSEAVMYFLALIWIADIAAFFTGKKFGKDKLAPEISPGKTIQGMYGAILSAIICAVLLALYYGYPFMIATDFAFLSVLTVLISIYGDLFFSLVKRKNKVKDSGSILPGHGGVLDRIDSVVAAAPFYYAGVILIGMSVFS
ncbi:MAG: phosphatidate cytidylyltransferase [Proteobacteria bacterium]|nr:phosphatidate cytidylyltransferase [Pseudomonadota bacterium]